MFVERLERKKVRNVEREKNGSKASLTFEHTLSLSFDHYNTMKEDYSKVR